jgi:hypothetical protein
VVQDSGKGLILTTIKAGQDEAQIFTGYIINCGSFACFCAELFLGWFYR